MRIRTPILICIALSGLHLATLPAQSKTRKNDRRFTVADSIEMMTFSDPFTRSPNATAKEAPDHSGFAVVTTHGLLSLDQLESSIWYFSRKSLVNFLHSDHEAAPAPRLLYRKTGRILIAQTESYGSLITELHWSQDSHHLLALVEEAHGRQHLIQIDPQSHRQVDLTPSSRGTMRAVTESGTFISYLERLAPAPKRTSLGGQAEVTRTGQSLFHILFPDTFPDEGGSDTETWRLHVMSQARRGEGTTLVFPAAAAFDFEPSLSNDGSMVVAAIPVNGIPSAWTNYRSAISSFRFDSIPKSADRSGKSFDWPWEYAIVDLKTKAVQPLWDAPVAWLAGYNNVQMARWAPGGTALLVTNTFLPTTGQPHLAPNSIKPCAVAFYSVEQHSFSCVVESKYPDERQLLQSAEFDGSENRIVTVWQLSGKSFQVTFVRSHDTWIAKGLADLDNRRPRLHLSIHQDLTVPPALWVEDGSLAKMLWDPNPQLRNKLFAPGRVIRWMDNSGYEWKGALLLPRTPKPPGGYPIVIQTHGFSNEHEFMPDGAFTTGYAAQPLASAGIAVLQMQDRAGRHLLPPTEEVDISAAGYTSAVDYLTQEGDIDPGRVGITGFSRASWYVEKVLEIAPDRFRAAILIDGVDQSYLTDVLFAPSSAMTAREHEGANGGKPYGPDLQKWLQHATGFNLEKITTPLRMEAIGLPSLLSDWEIYSILHQQGKIVELVEISNGQHILQNPKERYASQQGAVDWFKSWLSNSPFRPDASVKRE